uniref:Uncharacterized protein n=1 Tax=viral metagenome TaxID=1070528 RepID=A0A6M3IQL3_9ZZZZ
MVVAIAVSTNGKYTTFSSENATLATALSEVMNELDEQKKPLSMTKFVFTFDDSNNKYALVAIVRNH